jgi:phosphoserine aminotransferase
MVKGGKLIEGIFEGETINTPSMLAVEDAIDGLRWAESVGGLAGLIRRSAANLRVVEEWQSRSVWCDFLAQRPEIRSSTSICLKIKAPEITALSPERQAKFVKEMSNLVEQEGVAYDIASYRDAPPGLRVWGGATVETADMEALLGWLDYAFDTVRTRPL